MRGPGDVQSFALKRLWEVRPALGEVWAMMARPPAAVWILEVALPRFAIFGVEIEEDQSGLSGL